MTKHNHTQFSFWNETPTAAEVTVDVNTPAPLAAGPTSVAVLEVLAFCPRLLSALPAPATLVCACAVPGRAAPPLGGPVGVIVFTTSQPVYALASATWPVFTGAELAAVALAAEHDRGSPAALAEWCDRKATTRGAWRLTAAEALGPIAGVFTPRGWSIGRVFARYGLQLIAVGVGDDPAEVADVLSAVPLLAAGGVP